MRPVTTLFKVHVAIEHVETNERADPLYAYELLHSTIIEYPSIIIELEATEASASSDVV